MRLQNILRKLGDSSTAEVYYCGEYARDLIRRKRNSKIEVVVRHMALKELISYFTKRFKKVKIDKKQGTLKFFVDNKELLIRMPRKKDKPGPHYELRDDTKCKIFSINALFIPVSSKSKKREVIDLYKGRSCIKNRTIKTIQKASLAIGNNPIVMLQALSLAADLNYKLDSDLFYKIKVNSHFITNSNVEDIRDELIKILLSHKPSRYLKIMYNSGLMNFIIPELGACYDINQNKKYHKYDVFEHCLVACDNVEPVLSLRLAALFHDIGKAPTRSETKKNGKYRVTFYNHEVVGSKLTRKILKRLKFNKNLISDVSDLVYNHMYNYEPGKWSNAAVRRFIKKIGIGDEELQVLEYLPIFKLRKADRMANGLGLSKVSPRQIEFEERIRNVYSQSKALCVNDLEIDGRIIITEFKLKPGPTVGHILNYLLSLVIEDQTLNTREKLLEEASKYLSNALK